ncbi:MAG TPA: GAF domain-containing protein [Anaerolineae bacterium]|nr:GAF domain-containing protein [Anaerolineae bacterium]HQI83966.1 GAF domain-containing protein [Anaerolineae bacterium]
MWMRIRQFLAPPVFAGDEDKTETASLVNTILLVLITLITLASLVVILMLRIYALMGTLYVSMMVPMLAALWSLRRGHVRVAAVIIVAALWLVLVVSGAFIGGVVNAGYTTVTLVIIIAALLLGGQGGIIVTVVSIAAIVVVYIVEVTGLLPAPARPDDPTTFLVNHILNYGMSGALLYMAMRNLRTALQRARRLTAESELQREQLQLLVHQRTQDSERNVNYLQATTAVAREAAAAMGDPQELFARVVNIIQNQFGFYHVGLHLLDENAEWVELRAASGAGQELAARGFRLRAGVEGMIGDVVRRGIYRLAEDVEQEPLYLRQEDLPDTRSELVLPLQTRNQIIGVLDIQSAAVRAFAAQDVQTLQALADQVAMAISNARLVEQARQAAEVERRAYGVLTAEAWQDLLRTSETLGFSSTAEATAPAGNLWQPEMKAALQTGGTVQASHDVRRLAVPVKVRDEVIGVIDFAKSGEGDVWTAEEVALVESLTGQLGIALESARLYQDTQRAAARERLLGQVTGRMRESLDMDTVLKTAAHEMRQALGLEGVLVQLARPKKVREVDDGAI